MKSWTHYGDRGDVAAGRLAWLANRQLFRRQYLMDGMNVIVKDHIPS